MKGCALGGGEAWRFRVVGGVGRGSERVGVSGGGVRVRSIKDPRGAPESVHGILRVRRGRVTNYGPSSRGEVTTSAR